MSRKKGCSALLLLALFAVMLASCGSSSSKPSAVVGIVLFEGGPSNPSPSPALPGGFGSGSQGRPYRFVTVQVTATSGPNAGKVVAKLMPDARALFRAKLSPGSYIFKAHVPTNGPWPRATKVTVRAGQRTRVKVYVEGL